MITPQNPPLAIALMLAATAFIAATMLIAKALGNEVLGPPLHPFQITQGRYMFAFAALVAAACVLRPGLSRPNVQMHIFRASCGFGGVTLMFAAVAYIPLADATALSFLNPVFAMMLAVPFLGERVGPIRWTAAALALIGAVVLLRPTPASFQPEALLALGAAGILGVELILIKILSAREGPFQILLMSNLIGLVLSTLACLAWWHPPTAAQWLLLAGLGCCMAAAQACFVNALARADASFVTPFSYATLIFAAIYDAAVFGTWPPLSSWIGAGIIVIGAVLLALREAHLKANA